MPGRIILTLSAIVLFVIGGAALFAPDELAHVFEPTVPRTLPVVIQLAGSGLLGFAVLDWMSRRNRIGGIYARPLGLGNLMLFATAALTLGKAAAANKVPVIGIGACVLFALVAASYAWLVFGHDPLADAGTKSAA